MELLWFLLSSLFVAYIQCHNSESSEVNGIDERPFYDTIIFSDIADILNEFENHANSDSESGEDIEELLSEYQHYLDKAQKQRKAYIDKSETKNKVPLIRHEKYIKTKPSVSANYNKYYFKGDYYNKQSNKFLETQYSNPIDLFIPLNSKTKYLSKSEITTVLPPANHEDKFDTMLFNNNKILDLPKIIYKSTYEPNKPACFCKKNRLPCDCKCKQCMISLDSFPGQYMERTNMYDDKKPFRSPFLSDTSFKSPEYVSGDKTDDNTFNFKIRIDVSMPKMPFGLENLLKTFDRGNSADDDNDFSKTINLPLPFYNFPISTDMFGYNRITKLSKHDSMPLHKMTIQRKNKSKATSKKHKKKLITFHNIKLEPQFFTNHFGKIYNISDNGHRMAQSTIAPNVTGKIETVLLTEKPYENHNLKDDHTEDTIYLMVNITNGANNKTDANKNENSVETDYFKKVIWNFTTDMPIKKRTKRAITSVPTKEAYSTSSILTNDLFVLPISSNISKSTKELNNFTNSDKVFFTDADLLYWPSSNISDFSKNITAIILEKEHKKAKLNVSKETLRRNHTQALEQAIFGDVNWNDVDTIAPTFMSFIGKYINGALTFCSENVCHSMKCAEKKCVHRICSPDDRMNNKGHCAGSNNTDSVVSMESIMDLPSNVAFEIVDILQDKMLGKLFGKVTLCIMSKCISFAASKKMFTKSKCSIKELISGHCPNMKTRKNLCLALRFDKETGLYEFLSNKLVNYTETFTMKSLLEGKFKKIAVITLIAFITHFTNIMSLDNGNDNRDLFLNPWTKIKRATPKILHFDANGNVIHKNISKEQFVSFQQLVRAFGNNAVIKKFVNYEDPKQLNSSLILKGLANYMTILFAKPQKPKKLKILTNCDKSLNLCRFVACPSVDDYCTLCEVKMKESSTNSTTCKKYDTSFLTAQKKKLMKKLSSSGNPANKNFRLNFLK